MVFASKATATLPARQSLPHDARADHGGNEETCSKELRRNSSLKIEFH